MLRYVCAVLISSASVPPNIQKLGPGWIPSHPMLRFDAATWLCHSLGSWVPGLPEYLVWRPPMGAEMKTATPDRWKSQGLHT